MQTEHISNPPPKKNPFSTITTNPECFRAAGGGGRRERPEGRNQSCLGRRAGSVTAGNSSPKEREGGDGAQQARPGKARFGGPPHPSSSSYPRQTLKQNRPAASLLLVQPPSEDPDRDPPPPFPPSRQVPLLDLGQPEQLLPKKQQAAFAPPAGLPPPHAGQAWPSPPRAQRRARPPSLHPPGKTRLDERGWRARTHIHTHTPRRQQRPPQRRRPNRDAPLGGRGAFQEDRKERDPRRGLRSALQLLQQQQRRWSSAGRARSLRRRSGLTICPSAWPEPGWAEGDPRPPEVQPGGGGRLLFVSREGLVPRETLFLSAGRGPLRLLLRPRRNARPARESGPALLPRPRLS
uniref:serine/arginine repetitive matrix protein 1-like n=1 Tax=Podarcis muralis TaxID=64176 RepID=UPI0010A03562|nr:serine/arginine repetitive matrix protein 1-like [Podarcis muralis]